MKWMQWLIPRSWRDTVVRDLEDEARLLGRGSWWVVGQSVLVGSRLRPTVNGDAMWSDLQYAVRSLWRSKLFAVGALLTFALGIGVNVAVFSMVDRMMLRPLPYGGVDRLVVMGEYSAGSPYPYGTLDPAFVVETRNRHQGVVDLATTDQTVGYRLEPEGTAVLLITPGSHNLLDVLGVRPVLGRSFTERDATERRHVVIVTYEAWQTRFGGRVDAIGQRVWQGADAAEIIGILPAGFFPPPSLFGGRSDGVGLNPDALRLPYPPRVRETPPIVRLKDGVSIAAAEAELNALVAAVRRDQRAPEASTSFRLVPLRESMFGQYATATWMVILAASLVLLMCCASLASLMLVRARSRAHQTALQLALGATRARVVRAAVTESLCLATVGTLVAWTVVTWGHAALRAFVPEIFRRYAVEPNDGRVLVFAVIATVMCALIAGVGPVWRTASGPSLRSGGTRATRGTGRGGAAVLAAESLIAVLLVSGAAVTGRSLVGLARADLGFEPEGLHFVNVTYTTYPPETAVRLRLYTEAFDVLRQTPGVAHVAAGDVLPIMGAVASRFLPGDRESQTWRASDGFFATLGVPILAGREFTAADLSAGAAVSILSEQGAQRVWPGTAPAEAVGRTLLVEGQLPTQVVGVVGDLRGSPLERTRPSQYLPIPGTDFRILRFIARTAPGSVVPVEDMQRRLAAVGNTGRVVATPVDDRLVSALRDQRFRAILFGSFAVVALVLACVGLYAVTAFEVRLRRREMGVRLALGATPGRLHRFVLMSALWPVVGGAVGGVAVAWWTGEYLQAFVHRVDARDPGTLVLVSCLLVAAGAVAAWLPAREASRVDPATVLRSE